MVYIEVLGTGIGAIRLITLFGILVTHVLKLKKKTNPCTERRYNPVERIYK